MSLWSSISPKIVWQVIDKPRHQGGNENFSPLLRFNEHFPNALGLQSRGCCTISKHMQYWLHRWWTNRAVGVTGQVSSKPYLIVHHSVIRNHPHEALYSLGSSPPPNKSPSWVVALLETTITVPWSSVFPPSITSISLLVSLPPYSLRLQPSSTLQP